MKIKLFPFDTDKELFASVSGDIITINGKEFDLSGIPDGYRLPNSAIGCEFFDEFGFVERIGKTLHFTLRLPVQWNSPEEYRNPAEPIVIDARSGPVKFPDTTPIVIEQPAIELPEVPEDGGLESA